MERYDAGMSRPTPLESSRTEIQGPNPARDPASTQLDIQVNGDPERVPAGCTIEQLLDGRDLGGKRVAVAVDREVVPRSTWASVILTTGARVEILEAVGGG